MKKMRTRLCPQQQMEMASRLGELEAIQRVIQDLKDKRENDKLKKVLKKLHETNWHPK